MHQITGWDLECSTPSSVNSGPAKRPYLSSEMLARVREGCSYRTKCTKCTGWPSRDFQPLWASWVVPETDVGSRTSLGAGPMPVLEFQLHRSKIDVLRPAWRCQFRRASTRTRHRRNSRTRRRLRHGTPMIGTDLYSESFPHTHFIRE